MFDPSTLFDGDIESDAALLEAILIEFQERHEEILRLEHSSDIDVLRNELKSIAGDPWDDGSTEYPEGYPENNDEYMERSCKERFRVMVKASDADLLIETENGAVLEFRHFNAGEGVFDFGRITRFDVLEWEQHYKGTLSDLDVIDILDIGYWYMTGDPDTTRPIGIDYEPPVEHVRAQIKRNLRDLGKR